MVNLCSVEAINGVKPVLLMIVVQSLYAVVNILLKVVADDGMSLSVLITYRFVFSSAFIVPLALLFESVENGVKPVLLMVVVQSLYAVVNILLKVVADDGMSLSVLNAYRHVFSSAFIVPLTLLFERKSMQYLTGKVLFQAFLCGLFGGSLLQNIYVKALALISATYTTTIFNLVPAVTYIMVVSFRLEKPNLGTHAGKAKLLGTITAIGGAMILTLYEGRRIFNWSIHVDFFQNAAPSPESATSGSHLWGFMLAIVAPVIYSLWLIIQTKMSEKFPWHYSIAALTSIMAAIQSIIFALCTERDWSQWKLDWNLRLLAAASSGILVTGVCYPLIAWCVHLKGPLFVSAFSPLMLVLVALGGSLVLDEYITIGSLLGAVLIVCGLYMLLWGESKETRKAKSDLVSANVSVECDSIQICNQKEHDKKIKASVAPYTFSSVNNSLGEVQQLKI
ncbi:EamA domain [Sesbania bispinosa]|nr:EamA domain [Sesbania bispinosa]